MDTGKALCPCPICGKNFAFSLIESHASKCLFLNESMKDESTVFLKDTSPANKKNKFKPVQRSNQVKRKNSLDQFSSQSFQRDEEDVKDDVVPQKNVIIALFSSGTQSFCNIKSVLYNFIKDLNFVGKRVQKIV